MRKILFHLTKDLYPQVKDRYPYLYLERGRIEVDDSSVKWISCENEVIRLPIATVCALFLGPGTTITHAAIAAISAVGCTICWIGEESMKFYAYGMPPTADTQTLYKQIRLAMNEETRVKVARKMFSNRFPGVDLEGKSLQALMGMEGFRVKALYQEKAEKYGVKWIGRNYIPGKSERSEPVNKIMTFTNGLLYGLLTSTILAAGYSPRVGFVHSGSPMPFIYDIADLYKADVTIDLSFRMVGQKENFEDRHYIIDKFCECLLDKKSYKK